MRVHILEVLRGEAPEDGKCKVIVPTTQKSGWLDSPVSAKHIREGRDLLLFLKRQSSGQYLVVSPPIREFSSPEERDAQAKHARQLCTVLEIEDPAQRDLAMTSWLVNLLEDPFTAWEGVKDLMMTSSQRRSGAYWMHQRDLLDRDYFGLMADEQIARLVNVLGAPTHSIHERGRLAQILRDVRDERIDTCLREQLHDMAFARKGEPETHAHFPEMGFPQNLYWDAEEHMEVLVYRTGNAACIGILGDYKRLPYGDELGLPLVKQFLEALDH